MKFSPPGSPRLNRSALSKSSKSLLGLDLFTLKKGVDASFQTEGDDQSVVDNHYLQSLLVEAGEALWMSEERCAELRSSRIDLDGRVDVGRLHKDVSIGMEFFGD